MQQQLLLALALAPLCTCMLLAVLPPDVGAASCSAPRDCSYNGVCVAAPAAAGSDRETVEEKACRCAPQWSGPACATLVRLPADKAKGFHSPHAAGQGNGTSSWGGSILLDEATDVWHMYSAEMINDCGIGDWEPNSRVAGFEVNVYIIPNIISEGTSRASLPC